LAAAEAAAAAGVDTDAVNNTFVVAPQFLDVATNPMESEHYGPLPSNLLRWRGGRASGGASVDLDLDGDGTPDSGAIGSFDVMDALLERVCRRQLFPNLQAIVIAGHSNGGRFMARYAAVSRFEPRVATPRGVAVRYAVMGSGSYLYMNAARQKFIDDSYLSAATSAVWRDRIVSVVDHTPICKLDAAEIDHWPHGLTDLWEYPARVGVDLIRAQFGIRDVRYLVGELDLSPSFVECPERMQGPDTLAKTLLYFTHLEQFYGPALAHRLSVVPGVRHSGYAEMVSAAGSAALFGP
jgi:hypothetical protein